MFAAVETVLADSVSMNVEYSRHSSADTRFRLMPIFSTKTRRPRNHPMCPYIHRVM